MDNIDQQTLNMLAISIVTLEAENYNTNKNDSQIIGEIVKKIEEVVK